MTVYLGLDFNDMFSIENGAGQLTSADTLPVVIITRNSVDTAVSVTVVETSTAGIYSYSFTAPAAPTWAEGDEIHARVEATIGGSSQVALKALGSTIDPSGGSISTTITFVSDALGFTKSLLPSENTFSDEYVTKTLTRTALNVNFAPVAADTQYESGSRVYKVYRDGSYWDLNLAAYSPAYDQLVVDTINYENGVLTFNSDTGYSTIYLSGTQYDPYAAAAELLNIMAANAAAELTTYTGAVGSFSRSEKSKSYEARAKQLMTMAKSAGYGGLEVVQLVRNDS